MSLLIVLALREFVVLIFMGALITRQTLNDE